MRWHGKTPLNPKSGALVSLGKREAMTYHPELESGLVPNAEISKSFTSVETGMRCISVMAIPADHFSQNTQTLPIIL